MSPRVSASLLGLAGGGCWLAGFLLVRAGTEADEPSVTALAWTGYGFVVLAAAVAGTALVRTAPWWLRAVVAVGVALLVIAVTETLRGEAGDSVTHGIVGVVVVGLALLTMLRASIRRPERRH